MDSAPLRILSPREASSSSQRTSVSCLFPRSSLNRGQRTHTLLLHNQRMPSRPSSLVQFGVSRRPRCTWLPYARCVPMNTNRRQRTLQAACIPQTDLRLNRREISILRYLVINRIPSAFVCAIIRLHPFVPSIHCSIINVPFPHLQRDSPGLGLFVPIASHLSPLTKHPLLPPTRPTAALVPWCIT